MKNKIVSYLGMFFAYFLVALTFIGLIGGFVAIFFDIKISMLLLLIALVSIVVTELILRSVK